MKNHLFYSFVICLLFSCNDQETSTFCIGPIDNSRGIQQNPDRTDGSFEFNYLISSQIKSDINGEEETYDLDYFVNSTDGSIFLSKTNLMMNFGAFDDDMGSLDGVIFLPSGKVVIYVYDAENDQRRALTIAMDQTPQDKRFNDLVFLREFMENASGLREISQNPPASINGRTQAFAATITQPNGEKADMIMHFGENTEGRVIKTGVPLVGLGVGVLKDNNIGDCNRMVVYTKVTSDEGIFETTLLNMALANESFSGNGYKEAKLGFDLGRLNYGSKAISDDVAEAIERDYERMGAVMQQLFDCGDDIDCRERLELKLARIQNRIQQRAAENATDDNALGSEGTDFANKKRRLERELFRLQEALIAKGADLKTH